MKLSQEKIERACPETEILGEVLALDNKRILELGCGKGELTRIIATEGKGRRITALDVDQVQIRKHQASNDLPNVTFELAGAEDIPAESEFFDVVMMIKSLHHVPVELMGRAMREVHRVLKPGGQAYISEPLFQGDFNEILRLFHDEEIVRSKAFSAIQRAVQDGLFTLRQEVFFLQPRGFEGFEDFERKVIHVTHTRHELSADVYRQVKERFMKHVKDGVARFLAPIRADVLAK